MINTVGKVLLLLGEMLVSKETKAKYHDHLLKLPLAESPHKELYNFFWNDSYKRHILFEVSPSQTRDVSNRIHEINPATGIKVKPYNTIVVLYQESPKDRVIKIVYDGSLKYPSFYDLLSVDYIPNQTRVAVIEISDLARVTLYQVSKL